MESYIIGIIVVFLGVIWKLIKIITTAIGVMMMIHFLIGLEIKIAESIKEKRKRVNKNKNNRSNNKRKANLKELARDVETTTFHSNRFTSVGSVEK